MTEHPAWVPERLYPFEDRWVEVDGARVHYLDEGSGPPLLLLHGNPTWSFLYREIVLGCATVPVLGARLPGVRAVHGSGGLGVHRP